MEKSMELTGKIIANTYRSYSDGELNDEYELIQMIFDILDDYLNDSPFYEVLDFMESYITAEIVERFQKGYKKSKQ